MSTVAEYLVQELVAAGVTTVYGLPGGENVEILDVIRRAGIEFVLVKNESSACFMADVQARLTGTLGVALTTLGPGATNATVGLAHAYLDRAPILLITAQTDPYLIGTHTHQVVDLQSCFQSITKFTAEIDAQNALSIIQHSLSTAQTGRPGPVQLGIHNRVALASVANKRLTPVSESTSGHHPDDIKAIQTILENKKRPVMIVGLGLEPDKPYHQLKMFAEKLGAPLIDTPKSKGALSARHPLFAGTIGLTRTDPAYQILDESDCIIAIGFDVVELVKPWYQSQSLIWIANWDNQDPRIACDYEYIGNISTLLESLALNIVTDIDEAWGSQCVAKFRDELASQMPENAQANRILPQDVLSVIRANTPDDIIITTDVGSHKILTALNWQAYEPNTYFVSNGLSAMGFGLSSAIAAAKVTKKPTICITGDAGLAMVMGELGLIVELDLPIIVVVMNDSALDLIRSAQHRNHKSTFGTEFTNPDYSHIAKAYGMGYACVQSLASCADAINQAMQAHAPFLIEAIIDPMGYPTTIKHQ